jgi:hypothetical protein
MPPENQQVTPPPKIQEFTWARPSDALLIAGTPAFLYLLTLAFQYSSAITFDIPTQVISVTWTATFELGIFPDHRYFIYVRLYSYFYRLYILAKARSSSELSFCFRSSPRDSDASFERILSLD